MFIRLILLALATSFLIPGLACTPQPPANNQNDNHDDDDDDEDEDHDDDDDDGDDDDVIGDFVGFLSASVTRSIDMQGDQSTSAASAVFFATEDEDVDDDDINVNQKTIGACVVVTTTLDSDDVAIPDQSPLDAGSPGLVSNSTAEATLSHASAGSYLAPTDLAGQGFAGGQQWTFSFPGGADLASFTGSINVPGALSVSAPDLAASNLAIDTSAPLPFAWTSDGAAESVVISVSTASTSQFVAVSCTVDDTGSFTVPQAAMECLLANATAISISVQLTNTRTVTVNLVGGGTGSVRLSGVNGVTRTIIPGLEIPGGGFNPCDFIPCPDGTTCNPATFMCE